MSKYEKKHLCNFLIVSNKAEIDIFNVLKPKPSEKENVYSAVCQQEFLIQIGQLARLGHCVTLHRFVNDLKYGNVF